MCGSVDATPAGDVSTQGGRIQVWERPQDVSDAEGPVVIGERAGCLKQLDVNRLHVPIIHMYNYGRLPGK